MLHIFSSRKHVSRAALSGARLSAMILAAVTVLALTAIAAGPAHAASVTGFSSKLSLANQPGSSTPIDYRDRGQRYGGLFRHHRRTHPHNLRQLYPYKYRYHTPPRRYRYACAYDRWGRNHPLYRQYCAEPGGLYYVPKSFYRKHRYYRGRPYMREHYRNMRGRWR